MIKPNPHKKQKHPAQSMVEFALALPILLTLLYGLLETGRLLFIYGSTITAARQAARYGSATGPAEDGITPLYLDCAGIRAAAQKVGFINRFEDADILITYDGGLEPDGTPEDLVPVEPECGDYPAGGTEAENGDRIIVSVSTAWEPIVPLLPLKPFTITSTSERTLLVSVGINALPPPGGWGGSGAGRPVLKEVTPDTLTFTALGQKIKYTYLMENVSDVGTLTFPGIVANKIVSGSVDSIMDVDCHGITNVPPTSDPLWSPFICDGTYFITQSDFDNGYVKSRAYPTGYINNVPLGQIPTEILTTQVAAISLAKLGDPVATSRLGRVITYTYTITNTGNVTLRPPFTITDNKIGVDCSLATDIVPPGAPGPKTTTCQGTAVVTAADLEAHQIVNTAWASAQFKYRGDATATTITSLPVSFTVLTPAILLEVTPPATRTAIGPATYTYTLTNDTDYDATGVSLSDSKVTITSCPSVIPALSSITCTGEYTFTQADMDAGTSVASTSQATGTLNSVAETSNPVTVNVGITQTKALTASVTATPNSNPLVAGSTILYTYSLTNTGNVTLKWPITVTDTLGTTITCTNDGDFAPADLPRTCTGTYTVQPDDLAAPITTTGTATATFDNGTPETITAAPVTAISPTYSGPRFNLTITNFNPSTVTILPTTVEFTYRFTNTGSVTLFPPYKVTSDLTPLPLNCTLATPSIEVGDYTTCIGSYTVTSSGDKINTISAATVTTDGVTIVSAANMPQTATVIVQLCDTSTVLLTHTGAGNATQIWTIQNNSGATVHINTININWDTSGNRWLTQLNVTPPDDNLMTTTDKDGNRLFTGPWTVPAGSSSTITATFTKGSDVKNFIITFQELYCTGPWRDPYTP
jgi:uncharacterized repeat protein (TIGR01451 family)